MSDPTQRSVDPGGVFSPAARFIDAPPPRWLLPLLVGVLAVASVALLALLGERV